MQRLITPLSPWMKVMWYNGSFWETVKIEIEIDDVC